MSDYSPPIFPIATGIYGLTKRELFAAMAMQGLLACPLQTQHSPFAEAAVAMADALIAELAK